MCTSDKWIMLLLFLRVFTLCVNTSLHPVYVKGLRVPRVSDAEASCIILQLESCKLRGSQPGPPSLFLHLVLKSVSKVNIVFINTAEIFFRHTLTYFYYFILLFIFIISITF